MWLPLKQNMADNEWMYSGRTGPNEITDEWVEKTELFLDEIFRRSKRIDPHCPCAVCQRRFHHGRKIMESHLLLKGYMPNFIMPIDIAEQQRSREEVMRQRIDGNEDDGIRDMLDDLCAVDPKEPEEPGEPEEPEPTAKAFIEMLASSKKPLYEGAKISQLDAISQLLALKIACPL